MLEVLEDENGKPDGFLHLIPVARLAAILAGLPPDAMVYANTIGNLVVDQEGVFIGYIELGDEEFVPVDREGKNG